MNGRPNSLWRGALAVAGALLLAAAAGASTITVPNGSSGGTCGTGNANIYQFGGSCGSLVSITDTNPAYVQDNSPAAEGTYRVRFYANFDGKGAAKQPSAPPFVTEPVVDLSMASGNAFDFFVAYDGADPAPPAAGGNAIIRAELGQSGANRTIKFAARLNTGSEASFSHTLSGKALRGWRAIEINWAKASTPSGSNGVLQAWVDGVQVGNLTNLANGNQVVNMVRWGAVAGIDSGTSGTFKLDDFVSQRSGYIGPAQPFSDNTNTSITYWPFIQSIWAAEIMPGCTTSTFCPTSNIRRDEMAKFIVLSRLGTDFPAPACTGTIYGDVNASNPYCGYIEFLTTQGVLSGCGGGNYCPSFEVDRREMVVFILATLVPRPTGCTGMFADVQPGGPHATFCPWIELAATSGLTGGCGGGNYCPLNKTARNEMSVFLTQAFGIPKHVVGP